MTDLHLEDGHVVVTGKVNGKAVTIEGDIETTRIAVEENYEDYWTYNPHRVLKSNRDYTLHFKTKENGEIYKINTEAIKVEHTAVIEAFDRTIDALDKARERAKAPKNAKMRILPTAANAEGIFIDSVDNAVPCLVEFRWNTKEAPYDKW